MTAGDEYLPVPTIRRDENVLSAMVNKSTGRPSTISHQPSAISHQPSAIYAPADEVDNLDFVAFRDHRVGERVALEDNEIALHGDPAGVDVQPLEKLAHRQRAGDVVRVAVQGYLQFPQFSF
jgi:hypothetical protein